jgi:hypothetical protein
MVQRLPRGFHVGVLPLLKKESLEIARNFPDKSENALGRIQYPCYLVQQGASVLLKAASLCCLYSLETQAACVEDVQHLWTKEA